MFPVNYDELSLISAMIDVRVHFNVEGDLQISYAYAILPYLVKMYF